MLTRTSSWILAILLIGLPFAAWLEQRLPTTWQDRLALPDLVGEPSRHTPLYTEGTYLPPVIKQNLTLTPAQNPIIINGTTKIPTGVTLTLEPGVDVVANEFAQLEVAGSLVSHGTESTSTIFRSNEQNTYNQTWGGLIFLPGSQGTITYAQLEAGSPGISCLDTAIVNIEQTTIRGGSVSVYRTAPNCQIKHSHLQGSRIGLITAPNISTPTDTTINARQTSIKTTTP